MQQKLLLTRKVPRPTDREYSHLLEELPAAAYICDNDGLITYFNERAVNLWGRAPKLHDPVDRFCGSLKLFAADGSAITHHDSWMALALRNRRAYNGHEILIERPDGTRMMALAYANPFLDERGEIAGSVNILVDISDRRQAERARAHLAAIVDSSADAIISKNLDGIIQSWNAAAVTLFGYTAEQAVGRHISFLIPPERASEEDHILARLRAGERIEHFDTVRVRKDGRRVHVSLTISPIRDDAGRIIGASKIARDISDRKRDEEQIYSLLRRLQEADRRKDEFVAILAHELRAPLAPLCTLLEIMKRGDGAAALPPDACETMERQLGHMVRLVDDLLDLSRVHSNKLQLHKERIDLASVLRQAVEVCRPLAQDAQQQLVVNLPTQPLVLNADPVRLTQVFSNLLNNACKYTDAEGRIELTLQQHDDLAVIKVTDTGIGIPADKLADVFDMFAQVEASERSRGGLGIGLSLVKRLVEMHGGSVSAASAGPGRGSEFTVRLPLAELIAPAGLLLPPGDAGQRVKPRRILVVDDNVDSAILLATLLKIGGNETAMAHDGIEAIEQVEAFQPDIVLLDISLPKLDGYEAARRIRRRPWGKDVLLVALTGWGLEEDRRKSREAGFDEHLVKPLDYETLMKLVNGNTQRPAPAHC